MQTPKVIKKLTNLLDPSTSLIGIEINVDKIKHSKLFKKFLIDEKIVKEKRDKSLDYNRSLENT